MSERNKSLVVALAASIVLIGITSTVFAGESPVRIKRLLDRPIIGPDLHPSIGQNIQGPSVIRVPDWVEGRLGNYYLYFADHKGRYIRLAYADKVTGPWSIHPPGSMQIEDSGFLTEPPEVTAEMVAERQAARSGVKVSHDMLKEISTPHIASPDMHVDSARRQIVMYLHGLDGVGIQKSRVATSKNGIDFTAQPQVLGRTYMRIFHHDEMTYALAMPGQLYRSKDGFTDFEEGATLFNPNMRHSALLKRGHRLWVFWTEAGTAPEVIRLSSIDLSPDWLDWKETEYIEVLRPEYDWEGADAPVEPSMRSTAYGHVNQLRDPAILEDEGRVYLFYAVAGESGIAVAEVFERE